MQSLTLVLCVLCVASHLVFSMPVEQSESAIQQKVPLDQQETLITLDLADPQQELSTRDKRTIGILRQWFPGVSQILDNVIQSITRYLFRVIGRLVLRGGFLGGGGGGGGGGDSSSSSGSSGRRISITLPTYPPSADDEEEEDNSEPPTATELNPEDENKLAGAESQVNEVRVQYTAPEDQGFRDQDSAASGGNEEVDGAEDGVADESRDKRYSGFGSGSDGGDAEAHGGGSGGGSGNFLFDIIRLVTGGSGSASSGSSSSGGEHTEESGATAEGQAEKDAGYEAGIPGPITRLFVIANRGIANLIQDLILRLAQTSERIVNFKARLITSII